jgi:type I restriction enzyme S subunit
MHGYKQTKAGVVPFDWLDHTVGDLIEFEGGSQPDKSTFTSVWKPGYVRLIQIRDYKTDKYKTYVPVHLVRRFCEESDIMIGRYGPPIFQILRGLRGAYNVALIKAKTKPNIDHSYAYYFLSQEKLFWFVEKLSQRSSGQTGVDLEELRAYPLPIPPTKAEQEAIAEALSDADALTESLEQLVAKKRLLKQGAMQRLLTGKQRLPGFNGELGYKQTEVGVIPKDWDVKPLPDVCRFRAGKAHEQYISEFGRYICVNSKFISSDGKVRKYSSANFCSAKRNDVLMVMSDLPNGRALAKAYLVDEDDLYAVNQRICALTAYRDSPNYLFYILNRNPYFLKFDDGVNQTHLLNPVFERCPVPLPPTRAEQDAIAEALSDIDAEIAALEAKFAKTRNIQQGMMQELLSGRIRLV